MSVMGSEWAVARAAMLAARPVCPARCVLKGPEGRHRREEEALSMHAQSIANGPDRCEIDRREIDRRETDHAARMRSLQQAIAAIESGQGGGQRSGQSSGHHESQRRERGDPRHPVADASIAVSYGKHHPPIGPPIDLLSQPARRRFDQLASIRMAEALQEDAAHLGIGEARNATARMPASWPWQGPSEVPRSRSSQPIPRATDDHTVQEFLPDPRTPNRYPNRYPKWHPNQKPSSEPSQPIDEPQEFAHPPCPSTDAPPDDASGDSNGDASDDASQKSSPGRDARAFRSPKGPASPAHARSEVAGTDQEEDAAVTRASRRPHSFTADAPLQSGFQNGVQNGVLGGVLGSLPGRIPTGSAEIDRLFGGGLPWRGVHEWYGSTGDASNGRTTESTVLPIGAAVGFAHALLSSAACSMSGGHPNGIPTGSPVGMWAAAGVLWIGRGVWPHPRSLVNGVRAGWRTAWWPPSSPCDPDARLEADRRAKRGIMDSSLLARSLFIDAREHDDDPVAPSCTIWCIEQAIRSDGIALVVADGTGFSMADTRRLHVAMFRRTTPLILLLLRPESEFATLSAALTRWLLRPGSAPPDAGAPHAFGHAPPNMTQNMTWHMHWDMHLMRCKAHLMHEILRNPSALHPSAQRDGAVRAGLAAYGEGASASEDEQTDGVPTERTERDQQRCERVAPTKESALPLARSPSDFRHRLPRGASHAPQLASSHRPALAHARTEARWEYGRHVRAAIDSS